MGLFWHLYIKRTCITVMATLLKCQLYEHVFMNFHHIGVLLIVFLMDKIYVGQVNELEQDIGESNGKNKF